MCSRLSTESKFEEEEEEKKDKRILPDDADRLVLFFGIRDVRSRTFVRYSLCLIH